MRRIWEPARPIPERERNCVAFRGGKALNIEDDLVEVEAGEIVEVPPMVRHNVDRRDAPYEGFATRVPIIDDRDKVEDPL